MRKEPHLESPPDSQFSITISLRIFEKHAYRQNKLHTVYISGGIKKAEPHMQLGGWWARAIYQGPWNDIPQRYGEIFEFLRGQRLKPYGWTYGTITNESIVQRGKDAVVRTELPVQQI